MSDQSIQCWQCGTRMTLKELASNDGDCPRCEVEIALTEYLSNAMDSNDALRAELAALKAPAQNNEDAFRSKTIARLMEMVNERDREIATLKARPAQTEQQGYPHESMDTIALARYHVGPSGSGTLHRYAVRAGDGECELYRGSKSDCEHVARKLAGAFLNGGLTAIELYAGPIAQPADRLVEALAELLDCPYVIEPVTVPKAGIAAAPPYQVVGTMHVSLTRLQKARAALAAHRAGGRNAKP